MIRDPSDGSVKTSVDETALKSATALQKSIHDKALIASTTSGLPLESSRAAYQEKLDRSREWLRKYRTNPEKVVRDQGEQGE
jgi:hypothetical protein